MGTQLSPSLLAADLADLAGALEQCEVGGAEFIHIDVMDGHFVPNLTFGIPVIRALKRRTSIPLDVHLMVRDPDRLLDDYLDAGADIVTVHWEVATHLDRTLARIRERGARAGVALNPSTAVDVLADILPSLDLVLIMSVNPGFAGQKFLPYTLQKAERLRAMLDDVSVPALVEMDGGIGEENIGRVVDSGVDICVAGSAIFGAPDPVERMKALRARARGEK